ncbi:carcinoembryonic antigen-related cell adhesion molecule 1 [Scophthalmus maximus]|uniref:carcinoembryonic antigen-related cell adhesion molecule 1 n=1 Tax=Scophthalmus maximus TaxID=52904 RepID=UPI0015E15ACC|nr:carcinoembryonic antigen-related cell adhesion molecule 1 [Scophthalmus maximus]
MESPAVFLLILATITSATDHVSSQSLYASENPLIVGSNVTLYSTVANVTNGIWLFNNDVIVLIVGSEIIINNNWLEMVTYIPTPPTLTIRSLQLRDSGLYTLNALNFFTVQLTLSVQVPISNVTLMASETNLVEFNDTAVLMCSVSNGSSLSYAWLKNNAVVTAAESATLTIVGVTRNDEGPFRCNVSNGVSYETSPPLYLNISFGPSNTTMMITPVVPNHVYRTESNITLSCSALSKPSAIISWMFNGVDMNIYGHWIHLNNVTVSNSGNYTCVSHNTVTSRSRSAHAVIYVLDPLESVEVNNTGGAAIVNESFTLHCDVTGTVDRIQWWRNWHVIIPDNTTIFDMDNKTLTLDPVQHSDAGNYKCQAFNSVSNMTSSPYNVVVIYGPETPTITGPTVGRAGYSVIFSCYASSNPPSLYSWYFNGNPVANTSVYITPPLSEDMSGTYTCKAYNNITGRNKTAHKMFTVVEPITEVHVETPLNPPRDHYPYMLTCNVTGPAVHFHWIKNGMELHGDSGHVFQMHNETLTFNPLNRNESGQYKCMALNAVGNMTSPPYELLVNFGPDTPVITGPTFVETGQIATFKCSAISEPPSQFSWWFNGTKVANTSMFTTDCLSLNMSGEYTCMAYNNVTERNSTTSKMLTVVEAIRSVMIKNSTRPINSENFTLTCEVTGPYDTLYWTKNNTRLNVTNPYYHTENNMLHFTAVTTLDDGTYECVATNKAGEHKSPKFMLLVNYGPLKVEISGLYFHPVDLTVSMECSADSRPECDFYWFLDNESSAVIHTGSVITLIATKLSQGNYICVAKNPVTNITMYKTKEYVIGHASAIHLSSRGGLMMMGLFALSVPVLFT